MCNEVGSGDKLKANKFSRSYTGQKYILGSAPWEEVRKLFISAKRNKFTCEK
jgi:hypothetical protein